MLPQEVLPSPQLAGHDLQPQSLLQESLLRQRLPRWLRLWQWLRL
jgi:hypothetical protein